MNATKKAIPAVITAFTIVLSLFLATVHAYGFEVPAGMSRIVHLTFDTPAAGTIQDINGMGTGFTHRVPGTGYDLPTDDPNLDLLNVPGQLTITSTKSNIVNFKGDPPANFGTAETLGVKLSGIGSNDFIVTALFRGVHISDFSDQLLVFAANDINRVFRAGMHFSPERTYLLVKSYNGYDYGWQYLSGFNNGDDIRVTIERTGSAYSVYYDNLSNPLLSASDATVYDYLDTASDVYLGIYYSNQAGCDCKGNDPKTSRIDEFSVYLPMKTVTMDIKPGSFPNSINPRNNGVVPVAVLSTGTFVASSVDPATIRFGKTGTEAAPVQYALGDVNGDGDADLILHFDTQDTGLVCGTATGVLTGKTFEGQAVWGTDSVNPVGCK